MLAVLAAQLIDSGAYWTPHEVKAYAEDLGGLFAENHLVRAFNVAHGDAFRFEVERPKALRVALLAGALARRGRRPGLRTAIAFQAESDASLPITLRTGAGYAAAGAALPELVRRRESLALASDDAAYRGWVAAVRLAGHVLAGFSARQAEALAYKLHRPAADQQALAQRMGVSQQAISKHYRGGALRALLATCEAFATDFAPLPGTEAAKAVVAYRNPYEAQDR